MLIAYTDGSTYRTNPGPMSWAVLYVEGQEIIREASGALWSGTNNRAELLAVIHAIELEANVDLVVRTDSVLTLNIATGIWRPKTNVELWERFNIALAKRDHRGLATQFQHVKGHAEDPFNRRVDYLARQAAQLAASCVDQHDG